MIRMDKTIIDDKDEMTIDKDETTINRQGYPLVAVAEASIYILFAGIHTRSPIQLASQRLYGASLTIP